MIALNPSPILTRSPSLSPAFAQFQANQAAFRQNLVQAGARLEAVSFARLESLDDGHPFFGVLRDVRDSQGFAPDSAAAWRVDYGSGRLGSPQIEACSLWSALKNRGYYPSSLQALLKSDRSGEVRGGLLEEPSLAFAAVHAIHPSAFHLVPQSSMPSLAELSAMLLEDSWPLYAGKADVRIHGYRAAAYVAGVHDLRHFLSWKEWSAQDRADSVVLYKALHGVLTTSLPSLGSLAGRIGARLFYGDGFFHREMTALDECLSGPAATGNGIFPQMVLRGVAGALEGDPSRFYTAVEKAFAGSPREEAWREAVRLSRSERRSA